MSRIVTFLFLFVGNLLVGQITETYTTQTSNFNSLLVEKNDNPPFTGTYDNGSELAQYANGGSFGNTPGAAAFRTFTIDGDDETATARALQVGDEFSITVYVGSNPSAGGRIGISFRASTTYTDFFSSTDANTVARFQLDNTGGWKVYSGGTEEHENTLATVGSDRTLTIKITSSNTFNATIDAVTYYDIEFGTTGPITSFSIYTFGDSNPNSFWKNALLTNTQNVTVGSGSAIKTISGIISNGLAANSASTNSANSVTVSGNAGSQINLTGNNTYTGTTTINANATAEAQHASALGSTTSGTTVSAGGALKLYSGSGITYSAEPLTLNGTGVSNNNGSLRNVGGDNTWTGPVTLSSNSRIDADAAGSSGTLTISGNITGGSNVLYVGSAEPIVLSGVISGAGNTQDGTITSLFKDGSQSLTLSGANTYDGDTRITDGTLVVEGSGNLGIGSDVFISNGATLTIESGSEISINSLTVAIGGTVNVKSNSTLNINGNYSNSGSVIVEDGSSILMDAGITISGNMTVQRIGTPYKNIYNYWSSPVASASWSAVWGTTGYTQSDWYAYDVASQAFVAGPATLVKGLGYAMTGKTSGGSNTVSFTGTPHNGQVPVTGITDPNPGQDDYILLGNPYASAIDGAAFLNENSSVLGGTLWFWDRDLTGTNVTADYATWNKSGGIGSSGNAGNTGSLVPDGYIASCQGFMAQIEDAVSGATINFENAHRRAGNNTAFFKSGDNTERVWVNVISSNNDRNQLLVAFSDEATDQIDWGWDGKKLKGNPNIAFYSKLNGDDYAIQALAPLNGQTKSVPLGLDAGKAGNYTIAIDSIDGIDPGVGIYLHDVITNTYHDLRNSSYTLTVNQDNTTLTQYELVFNATPTGIDDFGQESWFTSFTEGQSVIVRSNGTLPINQLRLLDLQGRVVYSGVTNGPEARIATTGLASGIYLLEALSDKGLQTKKVFIP